MKRTASKGRPIRLDFNVGTRQIVPIYDVSGDGRQVLTDEGWVSSYREGVITQRSTLPGMGRFMTVSRVMSAIQEERVVLADKKNKHTAAYLVAKHYPIKEWMEGDTV